MLSNTKAMRYEDIPLGKPSKTAIKKEVRRLRETNINQMSSGQIVWHLVKKHKFGIVLTTLIVYVTFNLLGTLIIGLAESVIR